MSTIRRINKAGLSLIKQFEGLRLKAYKDVVGVLTIGYGSTGPHVKEGMIITEQQAEDLLKEDLDRFEQGVANLVKVPLNDNQFAALVSFSFNLGLGNLKASTLLKLLNAGKLDQVPSEFVKWNKAGGKVLAGLTRRRQAEAELFQAKV
jgi:lysozyme